MSYRAPRSITEHPGVLECDDAVAGGAEPYRHDVLLREGWAFQRGRMAGGRCGFFEKVADFKHANPMRTV